MGGFVCSAFKPQTLVCVWERERESQVTFVLDTAGGSLIVMRGERSAEISSWGQWAKPWKLILSETHSEWVTPWIHRELQENYNEHEVSLLLDDHKPPGAEIPTCCAHLLLLWCERFFSPHEIKCFWCPEWDIFCFDLIYNYLASGFFSLNYSVPFTTAPMLVEKAFILLSYYENTENQQFWRSSSCSNWV